MLLTPGTRLGPYEIESLIGSGGMGEVYKAHDGRLNRTVAIKRLIADNASQFQSEARAIAAINHPHICQIYDVGPDYLVLECLQGEPISGPVTRDEAVRLASQIADALHAAHERGILHRDLKPANVMVVRQGGSPHAKLLDFGIALGHFICGMHGIRLMREVAPFVRAEVDQALALNPSDPRPRFLLGAIALAHDYDWKAAETHFAASMNVPDVSGHARWIYASLYLRGHGRFEETATEMGRAVQQDPLNATWHAIWGAHLFDVGRFDQAIEEGLRATELEPNYFIAQHLLGEAYWYSGKWSQAIAAFERAYQIAPWSIAAGWLAAALWLRDEKARARQIIEAMGDSPEPLWGRVVYHLLTSDLDAAADWYGRMIDHRDPFALVYARASVVEPLRGHPRWPELAARMKLPAIAP